jgi:hypothetical protein
MAAHRAGASHRTGLSPSRPPLAGLGERSKAVSKAMRTVAGAWAGKQAVERQARTPSGFSRSLGGKAEVSEKVCFRRDSGRPRW